MDRLTKKLTDTIYTHISGREMDVCNELGQYEDLNEDLGINLITLFKVLKSQTFYSKHPITNKICQIILGSVYYCYNEWFIACYSLEYNPIDKECDSWDVKPKDYGITWASTKEELKDEK